VQTFCGQGVSLEVDSALFGIKTLKYLKNQFFAKYFLGLQLARVVTNSHLELSLNDNRIYFH